MSDPNGTYYDSGWGKHDLNPNSPHHQMFMHRIAEAQRAYDMAKPGEAVQIDADLLPYINQTEKS